MEKPVVTKNYYDVAKFLMEYPFNASQVGYTYLLKSITMVLDNQGKRMRLCKDIYEPLAEEFNVGVKYFEKAVREVLLTVSQNCYNYKNMKYPSRAIQNAFELPTAKSFIYAIVSQINLDRNAKHLNFN